MNVHTVSPNYKKRPIQASEFPSVQFAYSPSADGVDEHLLILFHGLGDTPSNFLRFGSNVNLPQTAILSIAGPCPIPGMSLQEGSGWFPVFTNEGDDILPSSQIAQTGLKKTTTLLDSFLETCVFVRGRWKETSRKVLFFGFSQGACEALDLALSLKNDIGGVVAMCGWLEQGMGSKTSKELDVLVVQGTHDPLLTIGDAKEKEAYLRTLFPSSKNVDVLIVDGKDHCLPGNNYAEMQRIMAFFASHMALRNLKLEAMSDIYEVK
ncbi:UNVERIFIED_CONTAM: hypothetical protein HDU68_006178 [Siphonaria sp. JEL0065]|nr:hypothetical protein HDU68_006178 [Siphonaria sp. JEL0065]